MLLELLQDRAALYVAGVMAAPERETFELVLQFRQELRQLVSDMQEVGTAVLLAHAPQPAGPPSELKSRILGTIGDRAQEKVPDSVVVTGPDGLIEWVNPAFSAMCGYSLNELKGQKPGALLQGPETDQAAVQRIREAVRGGRSCRESLLNYHKDRSVYRVEISIAPFLDDDGAPVWFIAKERKLAVA